MREFPFNCSIELARDLLSRTSDLLTRQQLERHINELANQMRGEPLQLATRRVVVAPQGKPKT
jgi:hypothetical protein